MYYDLSDSNMKFIDLFCGIGGFHSALSQLGHECVFACDKDKDAASIYELNFGITAHNDIRKCRNLPDFDILCAGFPCQPFSKSGSQAGFKDKTRGTLFHEIMRIIKESDPKIIFLENVPNLESHDYGNTYRIIKQNIENAGYKFWSETLSPHEFGTPQIRKRLFMIGIRKDLCLEKKFKFPKGSESETSVIDILEKKESIPKKYFLSKSEISVFNTWNDFISTIPSNIKPASPTWSQEFGRSYRLDKIHPISSSKVIKIMELKEILRNEGINPLKYRSEVVNQFPPYITSLESEIPDWKIKFIKKNRELWEKISKTLGKRWLNEVRSFKETFQKFEWQVGEGKRNIWDHIIQIRPSGIRVKKSNYIPALVAISQVPIIGWQKRRITPRECARAQDFDVDGTFSKRFVLHKNDAVAYKQLGNAVNVRVVKKIMSQIENYI